MPPIVYLVISRKQPGTHFPSVAQTKWSGQKDGPRTGLEKQQGWISLSLSNTVGWIQTAPEAELSRAPSCDRSVITTRWINTCVVKVK